MLTSIRLVQSYGRGGVDLQRFSRQTDKSMRAAVGVATVQAQFSFVVALLEAVAISAIVWVGVLLVDSSAISVGTLVFFILVAQNMFKPSRKIERVVQGRQGARERRSHRRAARPRAAVEDSPDAGPPTPSGGRLAFDGVTFAYRGARRRCSTGPPRRQLRGPAG